MADSLYLSLWFDDFSGPRMMAHALSVIRQFPFSAQQPGISYLALHPASWNEPTILERRFRPAIGRVHCQGGEEFRSQKSLAVVRVRRKSGTKADYEITEGAIEHSRSRFFRLQR